MPKKHPVSKHFFLKAKQPFDVTYFFLFLYTSIHQYLMNSSSKNEVKFKILLSGIHFSLTLCVFVSYQEPVGNPGQRDLLLLHLLQRERQHWYNTNTHTHAHKFKKTYVLCALALKLCSEQFCYFVETKQTHHYISMPNWSFWQKPKGQPAKHSVSVKLHKHVYVCLADNFCLWTQWNPWETLMRPQRQEVCSEHSADSRSLTLVSIKTRAMHA